MDETVLIGIIQLSDKNDGADFDEADEAVLTQFARLAAAAIEQTQTLEQLATSERHLEGIVNSIDQMIWSTKPDGHHDYYNQRWYEYTGVPAGSTDGEAWNGMSPRRPGSRMGRLAALPRDR